MGESGPTSRRRRGRLALGVGVAALALALAMALGTSRPSVLRATLTAGPSGTTRYQMARALAEAAKAQDVAVRLLETSSSDDELDLVNKGQADLALVSGAHVFDR